MKYASMIPSVGLVLALVLPVWATESGDSPPTLLYETIGEFDIAHDVLGFFGGDTFTISGIPAGATVERAYYITGTWDDSTAATSSLNLVFGGTAYGDVEAAVVDYAEEESGLDLRGYAVDVTGDVTGNGSYLFTATSNQTGTGTVGHLLVVVYGHETNPLNQIKMNFGAEGIRHASSTSEFFDVPAGPAELHLFTEASNGGGSAGEESIAVNGSVILGGPEAGIFYGNEGVGASYFELPITAVEGYNTVTLTTGEDLFGWHFAALVYETLEPIATEPVSWGRVKKAFR